MSRPKFLSESQKWSQTEDGFVNNEEWFPSDVKKALALFRKDVFLSDKW
jgi:hypothetical protein